MGLRDGSVVPALAGMSPARERFHGYGYGGPRTRGDEPISAAASPPACTWSPHSRG
ncbi:hypothetical protein HMPREF0573_10252 [Mobiluncus curtisii ATCC 43063]|uniref:Uncharacterized protein n=1 Tax=Mobiluncus curtisii (strain ATCC 43063 / DSM 2711 / V125) TaxID=548479 RepID=D6ZIM2_MOBCV|nr:hypothetical protein HMPREF0573_10252 [Mobiluncus curtisii ATCC 43063]